MEESKITETTQAVESQVVENQEPDDQKAQSLNIYQKLAKIRKQVEVIQRNKAGYGYRYVSEDEILARISGMMDKYSLSLFPSIVPKSGQVTPYHTMKTRAMKSGERYEENVNEVLVSADMVFTWINNDNPTERVEVPWLLAGHQSDASQSFGSGLSYSMRYFLLKFFNVATPEDDPDNWRSKQKAANAAEDKTIADEIIKNFDATVKSYLSANPGNTETVKKFIAKYVKGSNYFAITESLVASKLLSDFKDTFVNVKKG